MKSDLLLIYISSLLNIDIFILHIFIFIFLSTISFISIYFLIKKIYKEDM